MDIGLNMHMDLALFLLLRHGLDALPLILHLILLKQNQISFPSKTRARSLQYTLYGPLVTYIVLGSRIVFQRTTTFYDHLT
ncbi:hypothetical protein DFJ58DRAFT_437246 [Suillus subalutaceus]|uniref:uncharacterized protein n=1 Tax=Suillus subalutaceus TaxID=48586 RepID=UPI001B882612|nr:uncharacterized protein DFJ58DRAFT_437246 [Suillus subalutaceus]KAG1872397.1 hypothetical protein DFJ58DRAFT_437246 [Suillus subalutaceus]